MRHGTGGGATRRTRWRVDHGRPATAAAAGFPARAPRGDSEPVARLDACVQAIFWCVERTEM
jgi:hypothetical protein